MAYAPFDRFAHVITLDTRKSFVFFFAVLNDSCDLEFISKVGGTGLVAENLRKQSLYVKFDPLVANDVNNTSINGDTTLTNDMCNITLNDTTLDLNCR